MDINRFIVVTEAASDKPRTTRFEASFAFELEGIINGCAGRENDKLAREARHEFSGTTFESLVEGLKPRQSLMFSFAKLASLGNKPTYVWRILGRARDRSAGAARQQADALWEAVFLMLAGQQQYRFRAAEDPLKSNNLACWRDIMPRSVEVLDARMSRAMGFGNGQRKAEPIARLSVPMLDPDPSQQLPIATVMTAWPLDMEVTVELSPLVLTARRREALQTIAEALRDGETLAHAQRNRKPLEAPVVEASTPHWTAMIGYCLAHLQAIRAEMRVGAPVALPQALRATLGRALFPYASFEPHRSVAANGTDLGRPRPRQGTSTPLDLRNLLHKDRDILHSLLPDVSLLEALDLPKTYSLPPAEVASTGLKLGAILGQQICQTERDRLRHTYILGATGTGKSTLLFNMVMQDIRDGKGVCLVDPHGDLYQDVLEGIPPDRRDDVVLFDPAGQPEWPVGLNYLECSGRFPEIEKSLLINELIRMLDILYDLRLTGGPMFEQYMRNALLLLLSSEAEQYTLVDLPLVFEDDQFRHYLLRRCPDQAVVNFWRHQAERAGGEAALANMAPYITAKLNQFTTNPILRHILGQSHTALRFREIMDRGQILLVNLSKGDLSRLDSFLVGMLLIGKIFRAALSRTDLDPQERRPFYVYIDEFQNLMTDTMSEILSEARKFGLCLILANQHLAQLSDGGTRANIMDAVLGNVANFLFFRLGVVDAERLENFTAPALRKDDLQFLPDHHVVARILNNLNPIKPFVFKTHEKPPPQNENASAAIIDANRERRAKGIEAVAAEIELRQQNWRTPVKRDVSINDVINAIRNAPD